MNQRDTRDRTVRDYMRDRMGADAPPEFTRSVMHAIEDAPRERRRFGWPMFAGLATAAAAAVAVGVGLAVVGGQDNVGVDPSASASASPSASATTEASPTERASAAPTVSPEPSAEPTQSTEPSTGWTRAATFGDPSVITEVRDVASWSGGFIAVGSQWPAEYLISPAEPMVWTSVDGRQWSEGASLDGGDDVSLTSVATLPDGRLIVTGDIGLRHAEPNPSAPYTGTWIFTDAQGWDPLDVPFGDNELVTITAGPVGYVAAGGREIWFSNDGLNWELAHQTGEEDAVSFPVAGEEGFVVTGAGSSDGGFVLASGDGRTWFERRQTPVTGIAPIGGDWLGTMWTSGELQTINLMRSANGLDWSPVLDVNSLTPADGPKAGPGLGDGVPLHDAPISSADGIQVMSFGWNHCCVQLPMGTMTVASSDGESWAHIDLGEAPFVLAAAASDEVVVLVGQAERGAEGAVWVRSR